MTGRERLQAILNKQPHDGLAWTTLVDNTTLDGFPEALRGNGGIDFYRYLGCDIFLLNGWNTPYGFRSPELQWAPEIVMTRKQDGGQITTTWNSPKGTLTSVTDRGHPRKYPVDSIDAIKIYRDMWEGAKFVNHDDTQILMSLNNLIGDDGIVTRFWGPSTIPRLLEEDMGTESFYYLMADYPEEIGGLINTMHQRELDAFKYLAEGPWDSVTLVENTSTYYISPAIYEQYNMLHQRDFVDIVKQNGETALLHMCGHVHDLLYLIKETGCDGIHTLTPPPTGNTPWEEALNVIGDDLVIIGCLDPAIFVSGAVSDIAPYLDKTITPRLRQSNFILCPMADGIQVELERFLAVKEWMDKNGGR